MAPSPGRAGVATSPPLGAERCERCAKIVDERDNEEDQIACPDCLCPYWPADIDAALYGADGGAAVQLGDEFDCSIACSQCGAAEAFWSFRLRAPLCDACRAAYRCEGHDRRREGKAVAVERDAAADLLPWLQAIGRLAIV